MGSSFLGYYAWVQVDSSSIGGVGDEDVGVDEIVVEFHDDDFLSGDNVETECASNNGWIIYVGTEYCNV